eukprot:gnl/MRDRNA2_/MRDRNA2_129933_c0_seq1.p1 gnl/MRDRNA2_/MRDRNA2_129933_c0~~gnl/MRDRNA2_/MRDRNA2_129933_c0_seq1.p1  ORF type:complete len:507 (+),score=88.76 gnl/MRDRNA2_/MRDRNA2_129933_c0_seq1:138-1658(+)
MTWSDPAAVPIFLFVNPTSGGNKAAAFTDLGQELVQLDVPECGVEAALYIYNIKDGDPGNKPGFNKLKAILDQNESVGQEETMTRVIVGGGDGTVMWSIIEMQSHNIDMTKVAVGVMPFGTGNDFSRTLGWGGHPPKKLIGQDFSALKEHVRCWLVANPQQHDIWEVTLTTHEQGNFLFVQPDKSKGLTDGQRKQHNVSDLPNGGMHMVKPLCNYYSFGWDPCVGVSFDRHRTKSQFQNLLVYAAAGAKKQLPCVKPPRIDETLDYMGVLKSRQVILQKEKKPAYLEDTLVKCSVGKHKDSSGVMCGTPVELIALNLPSFARGCDLWKSASRVGVLDADGNKLPENDRKELLHQVQKLGDGCLNVLTYRFIGDLNFEVVRGQAGIRSSHGLGGRIYQGPEDLVFNFKDPDKAHYRKDGRVYMEIDGEFFIVRYPSQVVLRHKMKINVLHNSEPLPSKCACGSSAGKGRRSTKVHPLKASDVSTKSSTTTLAVPSIFSSTLSTLASK